MTETQTVQVYRVWIKATPEAIFEAITSPEWSKRYGYEAPGEYDLRPGGAYRGLASAAMKEMGMTHDVVVEGEVIEVDPPHKLVQTWRPVWDEDIAKETSTLTYEIVPGQGGITKLTITHDVENAPLIAQAVSGANEAQGAGGGWAEVLSDLKTLLETGYSLHGG